MRKTIDIRAANGRLNNIERCAEEAPDGTYLHAKELVAEMNSVMDSLIDRFRAIGVLADNSDGARELHAALYDYVLKSNPDASWIIASEGFGEHVDGPAGERVKAQAIRDRDCLLDFGISEGIYVP